VKVFLPQNSPFVKSLEDGPSFVTLFVDKSTPFPSEWSFSFFPLSIYRASSFLPFFFERPEEGPLMVAPFPSERGGSPLVGIVLRRRGPLFPERLLRRTSFPRAIPPPLFESCCALAEERMSFSIPWSILFHFRICSMEVLSFSYFSLGSYVITLPRQALFLESFLGWGTLSVLSLRIIVHAFSHLYLRFFFSEINPLFFPLTSPPSCTLMNPFPGHGASLKVRNPQEVPFPPPFPFRLIKRAF